MKKYTDKYFENMLEREKTGEKLKAGEVYAYRAWDDSKERESSIFECDRFPSIKDMEDFVWALRNAGVDYLAVTEQSTALMDIIHTLKELGCHFERFDKVTRKDGYGKNATKEYKALVFYVPVI